MKTDEHKAPLDEESTVGLPKIFKTWNHLYAFVIAELLILIALFYTFTAYFD